MSFIGIFTHTKNQELIKNKLANYLNKNNIIFVNDKNIENIKNIKFETIVMDNIINTNMEYLKKILGNAKYLILNADLKINVDSILKELKLIIITYGFNNKSTFTVSSISENNIIICLQRTIEDICKNKYEPQEFEAEIIKNVDIGVIIFIKILIIMYKG